MSGIQGVLVVLGLAVLALVVVMSVSGWMVLSGHRVRGAMDGAACVRCGSRVLRPEVIQCYECGADLREVGLWGSRQRTSGTFVKASALWLGALAVVEVVLMGLWTIILAMHAFASAFSGPRPAEERFISQLSVLIGGLILAGMITVLAGIILAHRRTRPSRRARIGVLLVYAAICLAPGVWVFVCYLLR